VPHHHIVTEPMKIRDRFHKFRAYRPAPGPQSAKATQAISSGNDHRARIDTDKQTRRLNERDGPFQRNENVTFFRLPHPSRRRNAHLKGVFHAPPLRSPRSRSSVGSTEEGCSLILNLIIP
jgi:hypothetical protein